MTHSVSALALGACTLFAAASCTGVPAEPAQVAEPASVHEPQTEIFYHLFQRSFYDSNGDQHGDLKGVTEKLDYLEDLGITSILLLPIYPSPYHHNYFADSFEGVDPEFGDMDDYIELVEAVHARGMKIYMDTEFQYLTENHEWWKDSFGNPASKYDDWMIYNDDANTMPESSFLGITELTSHDFQTFDISTVNLANPEVKEYATKLFTFWLDPNQDGDFSDGVDGFRIDHMMDDLDDKGILTNLFADFWRPLFTDLKSVNPDIKIIAEQATWEDTGREYFVDADVDILFGFGIRTGLVDFDPAKVQQKFEAIFNDTPEGREQFVFIENHDVPRYASLAEGGMGQMRVGAAYTLLSFGTPMLYYGQEIGMTGLGGLGFNLENEDGDGFGAETDEEVTEEEIQMMLEALKNIEINDGADIPVREAFEWYADREGPGMAYWYKGIADYWDNTNLRSNDGISFAEQVEDPASLWNFYKTLIELRKSSPMLDHGAQTFVETSQPEVMAFERVANGETVTVVLNFSAEAQSIELPSGESSAYSPLFQEGVSLDVNAGSTSVSLEPYGIGVWQN